MQISEKTKLQLFDLALYYFLPLLALHFITTFLSAVVEVNWLPSEKDRVSYLILSESILLLRLFGALGVFALYLQNPTPAFSRQVITTNIIVGVAFGSALTGFFFASSGLLSGFVRAPAQSWLFAWEILLFRYLPLFMFYGVGVKVWFSERHAYWKHILIATCLQILWGLFSELWAWSNGDHIFDPNALYPMGSLLLSVALFEKFGIYSALAALAINALAYQITLALGFFPAPSHLTAGLTMACLLLLMRGIQILVLRPELLQMIRSRTAAIRSALPTRD